MQNSNCQHVILFAMLANILGEIWRRLPAVVRLRAARFGQRRFTVTVAGMLFDDARRILLLEHVFRADRGWGVPGGFIKKGEQPEEALRRELREEVSIDLDDVRLVFTRTLITLKQVEIYYRARVVGEPKPSSFEIKQAQWFAVNDLPPELSQDQRKLIQRALALNEKCH
jgi:ADP-ribose pyrophosphatase YjhB (NUDIX family)